MSKMMQEVAAVKEHQVAVAAGEKGENDEIVLPTGDSPLEEPAVEAAAAVTEEAVEEVVAAEPEEEIIIGDQTFTKKSEALKYAQQLAREKELTDAHAMGVREALAATAQPAAPAPEEDKFEEEFYSNPKEALKKVQERAVAEAEARIEGKMKAEAMWTQFLSENPDIRRADAQRILQENFNTIGKMTDVEKAKKALAAKVRAEYAEIIEHSKPRTALAPNRTQAVSPAGGQPNRVTPSKEPQKVLSFAEEMRQLQKGR